MARNAGELPEYEDYGRMNNMHDLAGATQLNRNYSVEQAVNEALIPEEAMRSASDPSESSNALMQQPLDFLAAYDRRRRLPPWADPAIAIQDTIKVGSSMPEVSKAVLTPAEQVRLQNAYQSLAGIQLGRLIPCPQIDCKEFFQSNEREKLSEHFKTHHVASTCPWCPVSFTDDWNASQRARHMSSVHYTKMLDALTISSEDYKQFLTWRNAKKTQLKRQAVSGVSRSPAPAAEKGRGEPDAQSGHASGNGASAARKIDKGKAKVIFQAPTDFQPRSDAVLDDELGSGAVNLMPSEPHRSSASASKTPATAKFTSKASSNRKRRSSGRADDDTPYIDQGDDTEDELSADINSPAPTKRRRTTGQTTGEASGRTSTGSRGTKMRTGSKDSPYKYASDNDSADELEPDVDDLRASKRRRIEDGTYRPSRADHDSDEDLPNGMNPVVEVSIAPMEIVAEYVDAGSVKKVTPRRKATKTKSIPKPTPEANTSTKRLPKTAEGKNHPIKAKAAPKAGVTPKSAPKSRATPKNAPEVDEGEANAADTGDTAQKPAAKKATATKAAPKTKKAPPRKTGATAGTRVTRKTPKATT